MDDGHHHFHADFNMADFQNTSEMHYDSSEAQMTLDPALHALTPTNRAQNDGIHNTNPPVDMEEFQKLLAMVSEGGGQSDLTTLTPTTTSSSTPSSAHPITTELLNQMKLQQLSQLHQMQSQIFQQQMELLRLTQHIQNGGPTSSQSDFAHGLPTPVQSYNLQPQMPVIPGDIPPSQLVSPMLHPQQMYERIMSNMGTPSTSANTSPNPFPQPVSAPARLAFGNVSGALPSPGALEYDLSPISSPWLGPTITHHQYAPSPQNMNPNETRKRGSSFLDNDSAPSRKRQSSISTSATATPQVRPRRGTPKANASSMTLTSSNSTHIPSYSKGVQPHSDVASKPQDTPSPVDLSMPPPAPVTPGDSDKEHVQQDARSSVDNVISPYIEPVTPASIMGLLPSQQSSAAGDQRPKGGKGKGVVKGKVPLISPPGAAAAKPLKKANGIKGFASPSLKPILPDNTSVAFGISPTTPASTSTIHPFPGIGMQFKKNTSHKAAEQKRRDSLKTSFDDLRMLLPPIPLPTEDSYSLNDPPLPGSLPPRGPPKGEPEGPNRNVSKLQLLRCGNDYIRALSGQVARRDDEISTLRNEIQRLRQIAGDAAFIEGTNIDLEKDLDAAEREAEKANRANAQLMEATEEEGDDE